MEPDRWSLYREMLRSRRFEEAVRDLWEEGAIPGEMHPGMGEEAIAAGVVAHLEDGDALALDHRGTPPLVARGVDLVALLRECLGRPDGLCGGRGGHMHLFSREHLAASSGIVGAAGPTAVGFALAAEHLRPATVAVAFFGDGAMNQGMLLESMNLAAALTLPVLFVCKDNAWAITTHSPSVTRGDLVERARGLGVPGREVDGADAEEVFRAAGEAIGRARGGGGPWFFRARCVHLEGHFLGDPLLRVVRHPAGEMKRLARPLLRSFRAAGGAGAGERAAAMGALGSVIGRTAVQRRGGPRDPVARMRRKLDADPARLERLETEVAGEIRQAVERALAPAAPAEAAALPAGSPAT